MKYLIDRETLLGIAALIRAEEKSSAPIPVSQFESRLRAILDGKIDKPSDSTPDDSTTEEQPLYKIGLLSDVHIQYDTDQDGNGNTDWKDACLWYQSNNVDAICIAGDLTKNGYESELEEWKTARDSVRGTIPVYSCSGNHESIKDTSYMYTNPESMRTYLDSDTTSGNCNFYKVINNDVFAFMSCYVGVKSTSANVMFDSDSLEWLENLLETYRNRRVFLFQHIPPSAALVGNFASANGLYSLNLWGSNKADRNKFLELMAHYKNVIWFSGHTHIKWELANDYEGLNYMRWNTDGARMIHLSSTTVPRDVATLTDNTYLYAEGQAALMNVYSNKVVIKGYDLIEQKYISEFNLEIDTTPVTIAEKEDTPAVPEVTLSSISATKTKTTYEVGESVATNDISVTATYSDGSTASVTGWTSSSVDTSSAGTKTMTISYNGKTTTISITVNAAAVVEPEHQDTNVPLTWTTGNLSYTTGQVSSSTDYAYSNDIEHTSGATYTITSNNKYSSYPKIRVVEFDSNRNVLGYTAEILSASTNLTCEYTPTNDNAAFIVLRMNSKTYTSNLTADGVISLVKHT